MTLPDIEKLLQLSSAAFFVCPLIIKDTLFGEGFKRDVVFVIDDQRRLIFVNRIIAKVTSFSCPAGRNTEKPIGQGQLSGGRVAFGPGRNFKCLGCKASCR